jgi:hypothetical protein
VLELDSTGWADIKASPGGDGMLTAQLLAHLRDGDESAWGELYQQVCHQNSVGEVAYVAAPHMVAIARVSTPRIRALLLSTVGSIVASAKCYRADAAKPRDEWRAEFDRACAEALVLASESLRDAPIDRDDSLMFIQAVAALHGHANLALLLQDGPDFWCPECGEPINYGRAEE